MSLINKMLSDLEQRHSYYKDQDKIVLGGLAPVTETGFSSSRIPYNFLLVCFFFVAICIAIYGYLGNAPYQAGPRLEVTGQAATVPDNVDTGYQDNDTNLTLPDVPP